MSSAVALKPVLPIFQALAWRIIHISLRFWTSIADKERFWTENADMVRPAKAGAFSGR
jgi:hypothetical protein